MRGRAKVIVVAGLLEKDSGKTWFTNALVKGLRSVGVKAVPFKPVAGFNIWGSLRTVEESIRRGILLSNDLLSYIEFLGLDFKLAHIVNPIVFMLAYQDPEKLSGAASYLAAAASVEHSAVVARLPIPGERCGFDHYVFEDNAVKLPDSFRGILGRLLEATSAKPVAVGEVIGYAEKLKSEVISCMQVLVDKTKAEVVVVESFNNALQPVNGIVSIADLYLMVAPGKAFVYHAGKIAEFVELVGPVFASTTDKAFGVVPYVLSGNVPLAWSMEELSLKLLQEGFIKRVARLAGLV